MSSLIESIRIRGGDVQQITQHGLSFLELSLPVPGFCHTKIQIKRECVEATDDVLLDALREAQVILDTVTSHILRTEE